MTNKSIVPSGHQRVIVLPKNAGRDIAHRLDKYHKWLDENGHSEFTTAPPYIPLKQYHEYLKAYKIKEGQSYKLTTIEAHLGTLKGLYHYFLQHNQNDIYAAFGGFTAENAANQKAIVDRFIQECNLAIDSVKPDREDKRDDLDSDMQRLTVLQVNELISQPDTTNITGLRDLSIICLALATGMREGELSTVEVQDIKQKSGGQLGVYVRMGKGDATRFIPYGELNFVVGIIDMWTKAANITEGCLFRPILKNGRVLLNSKCLSTRSIEKIMRKYPIYIDGVKTYVKPHSLRRTYARTLYDSGMQVIEIQQNLGHKSLQTTLHYIGNLEMNKRAPGRLFNFDMGKLERWEIR